MSAAPARSVTAALLPFALIMFLGYSALGLPLSVLPVYVHASLGYGTLTVGIAVGLAAAATLLTRQAAGSLSDRRGPKLMVAAGLAITALAGAAYAVSSALPPGPALWMLLAGRVVLGIGDSLFTTALMAWCIASVGAAHAGRVISWIGLAMYGALAVMAPVGEVLEARFGFAGVGLAVAAMPLLGLVLGTRLRGTPAVTGPRPKLRSVVAAIWPLGLGLVLASSGFGTIAAFLALRYLALGWSGAGLALASYSVMYIVCRLLFPGLPDRLGGARLASVCLATEIAGLLLIAFAVSPAMAFAGCAITGLGYSLVFPSLGVEAVRRVPPESRGVTLGLMLACFDLGLGAAGPVTGVVAAGFGLPAAFVTAAIAAAGAMLLVNGVRARALKPAE
jgi:MFS family permease